MQGTPHHTLTRITAQSSISPQKPGLLATIGLWHGTACTHTFLTWVTSLSRMTNGMVMARSTARVSTGQRVSLNSIEEASKEERDGHMYWVYEHLSQVSVTCWSSIAQHPSPPGQQHLPWPLCCATQLAVIIAVFQIG